MGQYFLVVNPAKKQYIAPGDFGDSIKLSVFPWTGYIAYVVTLLACRIDSGSLWEGTLAGSWAGDTIIVAGDEQAEPNWYGFEPSTNKESYYSLYEMARAEFGSISHKVMAMLCEAEPDGSEYDYDEDDRIPLLIREAQESYNSSLLLTLGNAVFEVGCEPLEKELLKRWGPEWIEAYHKVRSDRSWVRLG